MTAPASLLPAAPRGILRVTGADRVRFLHGQTTQDVKKLKPGEGAQALAVTNKGKVLGMLLLLADEDAIWVETDPERAAPLKAAWERMIIMDDVALSDRSSHLGVVALSGDGARGLLAAAAGREVPDLPPLGHAPVPLAGQQARLVRACRAGGPGLEFWTMAAYTAPLRGSLQRAGALPLEPAGEEALRIRNGIPRYGVDVTEDHLPQEAGFDEDTGWVSYTKGCFVGQETIARLHHLGQVQKRLCLVEEGGRPALAYRKRAEALTPVSPRLA